MRQVIPILIVVILTAYGPLSMIEELEDKTSKPSDVNPSDVFDVPDWRIGDKWVYETGFDVNGLIEQANVSASVDALLGDTTVEVENITFMDIEGVQTLVYIVDIYGEFETGRDSRITNPVSGDTFTGKVVIEYRGQDIYRVSDLAQWNMTFSLTVRFLPYAGFIPISIFTQTLAEDLEFSTIYNPPREKYDFPLRTGDQWVAAYESSTNVSGTSSYFDPAEFNTPYVEDNTTYQATADGTPIEEGETIDYTGCSNSIKVNNWNNTGVSGGFDWYCDAVRNYAWYQIDNPAGFTIDWKLKTYEPVDSSDVIATSSPGTRDTTIDVTTEFIVFFLNGTQEVEGHFTNNGAAVNGTNLQLRYESEGTIMSLTTDSDGKVTPNLDVGSSRDASIASDDWTSNGVIIWDPVDKVVGAASIVLDLSVVGVDLIAKPDSMIITRIRGNDTTILSQASGYNALPGDYLEFQIPAQNRGIYTSPETEIKIITPDGITQMATLPAISPYNEARVNVNWSVPSDAAIGNQTLSFMVDPDNLVTADADRTNNNATLDIYIGRMPVADLVLMDGVYTFENVTIDASGSYDGDGGNVECYFEIKEPTLDGVRTERKESPTCVTSWFWADDGDWEVKVIVVDDELDEVHMTMNATILNRAPYVNLTTETPVVQAGQPITFDASDSGDIDTVSESGQVVQISWPGTYCDGTLFGPVCTFTAEVEGTHEIEVVVTDDDNESVSDTFTYEVLNVAPTTNEMRFSIDGIPYLPAEDGTWTIDEDIISTLEIDADDTLSDKENLLVTWYPDATDLNWTITTSGPSSSVNVSWGESGLYEIKTFATDNDGVKSEDAIGYVRVNNIDPVLDALPAQKAIFEDDIFNQTAFAVDFADQDELRYCWDLLASIDSDENGIMTDDCDFEGQNLRHSWSTPGLKIVTANVWDDDNATDSFSINVTIVNRPPAANIFTPIDGFKITEGESITFSGVNSSDSPTDRTTLRFIWDDPNTAGATQDGSGETFTIKFDTPGKYFVNLTVTDDDGKSSTASVLVTVDEQESEGLFGVKTTTAVGGILGVFILVLVALLLVRGRGPDSEVVESKHLSDYGWSDSPPSVISEAPTSAPQQFDQSAPPQPDISGPPLPASGLPQGWTMEQWSYYGEQYLASMPPAPPNDFAQPTQQTYQPQQDVQSYNPLPQQIISEPAPSLLDRTMVQEQPPTPASQALADILDDLDL